MQRIWDSYKIFFPNFPWGEAPFSAKERTWWDTAASIWNMGKWLFDAFRENYILCCRSTHLESPSELAQGALESLRGRWFPDEIPLSSRMDAKDFVIQRFEDHPKVDSVITAFFGRVRVEKPAELTVRDFFRNHVFKLPFEQTMSVPNPKPCQAFWLTKEELEKDLGSLIESLALEGTEKLQEEHNRKQEHVRQINRDKIAALSGKENLSQRESLTRECKENQERWEGEFKNAVEAHKKEVTREFFGGETIDTFAGDPGKFLARLDTYFREHFSED